MEASIPYPPKKHPKNGFPPLRVAKSTCNDAGNAGVKSRLTVEGLGFTWLTRFRAISGLHFRAKGFKMWVPWAWVGVSWGHKSRVFFKMHLCFLEAGPK